MLKWFDIPRLASNNTDWLQTEESNTYKQGEHDINTAFESPNHPGLLIHDSRGWQAGSDHELDLIAQFLRHRAFQKDPAEALHVIWSVCRGFIASFNADICE